MIRNLIILLIFLLPFEIISEEKKYGSLIYNSKIPSSVFVVGKLRQGDSFNLRKLLRNHEITEVILASPGGSVMVGLNMAGIIFDKGLSVYIPEKATCSSSCAFMFFAGKERKVRGKLGVHQFYFDKSKTYSSTSNEERTQITQLLESVIIGFLNEFGVPRFVLERMFQQKEIYYFNQDELDQLMTDIFSMTEMTEKSINHYWLFSQTKIVKNEPKEVIDNHNKTTAETNVLPEEAVVFLQRRLNKIGCNAGPVDGKYGRKTKGALKRFAKQANLQFTILSKINKDFFEQLIKAPIGFCPNHI